ncbi:hypothetical protein BJ170DRAFT_731261 [Xylariales sp. AK1849]|nr:hypothetical protein BJ170DRAFT_731261 [Xylariales sp. AK1849]
MFIGLPVFLQVPLVVVIGQQQSVNVPEELSRDAASFHLLNRIWLRPSALAVSIPKGVGLSRILDRAKFPKMVMEERSITEDEDAYKDEHLTEELDGANEYLRHLTLVQDEEDKYQDAMGPGADSKSTGSEKPPSPPLVALVPLRNDNKDQSMGDYPVDEKAEVKTSGGSKQSSKGKETALKVLIHRRRHPHRTIPSPRERWFIRQPE